VIGDTVNAASFLPPREGQPLNQSIARKPRRRSMDYEVAERILPCMV